ncbi:hypothetical protein CHS0354_018420 [Potamilus streckersoni]|uniref:Uncharacterized protein n=1 Tax=Potamilus streckersoni TaxID=2493646 RepID=A0AAE0W9X2_9BIVA|nr:hypothetical protein CHS0354_018420 [Potamilus streckersoni]
MSLSRPTLTEIEARVAGNIRRNAPAETPGPVMQRMQALGKSLSAAVYEMYGYADYTTDQVFPDTADEEYLLRAGQWRGYSLRPASYATGRVRFEGTAGTHIPSGLEIQNMSGIPYMTTESGVIDAAGFLPVNCQCKVSGTVGNYSGGMYLSSLNSDITALTTAETGFTGGAEQETIEDLRARILRFSNTERRYGRVNDYSAWALESSSSVAKAWERPNIDNTGTLGVYIYAPDNVITQDIVNTVQAYIDARKIYGAVKVLKPQERPIRLSLSLTVKTGYTEETIRGLIKANLKNKFDELMSPGYKLLKADINTLLRQLTSTEDPIVSLMPGYTQALKLLLPQGEYWEKAADDLTPLFDALSAELARFELFLKKIIDEADPTTAQEFLTKWERELSLTGNAGKND